MADQKISDLTEVTTPLVGDFLAITNGGVTKKVTPANLRKVLDWDMHVATTVVQDVVNSAVFVQNSELTFAFGGAGEVWYLEWLINYSGTNAAVDIKVNADFPAASQGSLWSMGLSTADANINSVATAVAAATWSIDLLFGTLAGGLGSLRSFFASMTLVSGGAGNFTIKQANNTAGVGNTSRIGVGSLLRGKRLV